jgi:hypothetical protein
MKIKRSEKNLMVSLTVRSHTGWAVVSKINLFYSLGTAYFPRISSCLFGRKRVYVAFKKSTLRSVIKCMHLTIICGWFPTKPFTHGAQHNLACFLLNQKNLKNETNECVISPFMIKKVITPRRLIDALSSAAVITPLLVELNKSNTERRTRICASTLENLRRNILCLDESSSPTTRTKFSAKRLSFNFLIATFSLFSAS